MEGLILYVLYLSALWYLRISQDLFLEILYSANFHGCFAAPLKTPILNKVHSKNMSDDKLEKLVQEIYDADENPLAYMIEPRGSAEFTDKNDIIKKEDLENIL